MKRTTPTTDARLRSLPKPAIFALAFAAALSSGLVFGSSHREAPLITQTPKVDGTDFYMFRSYETGRAGYVTFLANYQPLQAPYGGPNYFLMDPNALYAIHIDNDGDAKEDISYYFRFYNKFKNITLPVNGVDVAVPLSNIGSFGANPAQDANRNVSESFTVVSIVHAKIGVAQNLGQAVRQHRRQIDRRLCELRRPAYRADRTGQMRRRRPRVRRAAQRGLRGESRRGLRSGQHQSGRRAGR